MTIQSTVINILDQFAADHENISWEMSCAYSDGMGTTINQITILHTDSKAIIGIFTYHIETGNVLCCMYDNLTKSPTEGIVDMLLDMMNYEKEKDEGTK